MTQPNTDNTESNADRELEQVLAALSYRSVESQYSAPVTSPYDVGYVPNLVDEAKEKLVAAIKSRELAFLSRIEQAGPKDLETKPDDSEKLRTAANFHNAANLKWRTAIDNIAKEIRGEA